MFLIMMMIACSDKLTTMEKRAERSAVVCYSGSRLIYASEVTVDEAAALKTELNRPGLMRSGSSDPPNYFIWDRRGEWIEVVDASCVYRWIE